MARTIEIECQALRPEETGAAIQDLIAYWEQRRNGRLMPVRRDLDVVDMRPWLGRLSLYEVMGNGDLWCRLRGSTMCTVPVPGHASDRVLVSETKPRVFAEMGIRHYLETFAGAAPTNYRIALSCDGARYDYERVALPLAAGGDLPPMVLTFITCDIRRARDFWYRYSEG